MFLPETYQLTLALMILSMFCWGSWANTLKLCPNYRFQLFYCDYTFGVVLGALAWGFTAGTFGRGTPFWDAVLHTPGEAIAYAICGGIIFNIANLPGRAAAHRPKTAAASGRAPGCSSGRSW